MTKSATLTSLSSLAALLLFHVSLAGAQDEQTTGSDPLIVQEVTCAGNAHTSCDFIREHLYLQAGQPLDEEEIRNAELRLSSLRNFKSVSIRLEKGAQRGAVTVVMEVEEASPITTESLLGASSRMNRQGGQHPGPATFRRPREPRFDGDRCQELRWRRARGNFPPPGRGRPRDVR